MLLSDTLPVVASIVCTRPCAISTPVCAFIPKWHWTIDAGRSCLDIVQQLHAVEAAIANAKRTLIHDHLDHRLDDVVGAIPRVDRWPIDALIVIDPAAFP